MRRRYTRYYIASMSSPRYWEILQNVDVEKSLIDNQPCFISLEREASHNAVQDGHSLDRPVLLALRLC